MLQVFTTLVIHQKVKMAKILIAVTTDASTVRYAHHPQSKEMVQGPERWLSTICEARRQRFPLDILNFLR